MNYMASTVDGGARRRVKTGPLPVVPWRSLERPNTLETRLPLLLMGLIGLVLAVQLYLHFG